MNPAIIVGGQVGPASAPRSAAGAGPRERGACSRTIVVETGSSSVWKTVTALLPTASTRDARLPDTLAIGEPAAPLAVAAIPGD